MIVKYMLKIRGDKAQVTLFIIIALLIVSVVLVWFLWVSPTYIIDETKDLGNFESCMKNVVEGEIDNLGLQAGFINPDFYYKYGGDKIGYLCYTNLYYKGCVNQKPFLKQHFTSELKKKTEEKIHICFENSLNELKSEGYQVLAERGDFDIDLTSGQVKINYNAPVVLEKGSSQRFTKFGVKLNNNIYDLLMIATSIIQYETKYGDSDTTSLLFLYDYIIIDKFRQGDETTIYILEDKNIGTKFQFASRSYAWPPGYGSVISA